MEGSWNMRMKAFVRIASLVSATLWLGVARGWSADTLLVTPTGGDDTLTLQAAFDDAVAAGPGSTVRLAAGHYCVSAPVIVRGFDGRWLGAGRDLTVVETCADPFPVPQLIDVDPGHPGDPQLSVREPFLFLEVEGRPATNLEVADLTLRVKGTTNVYYRHGVPRPVTIFQNGLALRGKRPTVVDGQMSRITLKAHGIAIDGEANGLLFGAPSAVNVITGISLTGGTEAFSYFGGDISARRAESVELNLSLTRSHMQRVGIAFGGSAVDSTITVGGSQGQGNTFDVVGEAFRLNDTSRSTVTYSYNSGLFQIGPRIGQGLQTFFGIDAEPQPDVPLPGLSRFVITHNDFRLQRITGFSNGVEIVDLPVALFGRAAKTADVLVAWNSFDAAPGNGTRGVFAAVDGYGAADCLVQSNLIRGRYDVAAIALGYDDSPPGFPGIGFTIKGNNLQQASGGFARILLGPVSSDNVVVGGSNKTNVLDVGSNNSVTGVSNMNGNAPGPALREAAERRRALLEASSRFP